MILHTIVDLNDIFSQPHESENVINAVGEASCIINNGVLVQGQKNKDGFIIERIISTNPDDFLNKAYAPGKLL